MKSYYTVIYIQTNAAAQDRLAIGMVMIEPDRKQVRYGYSARKLRLIGELVRPGLRTGLRWSLENLGKLFSPSEKVNSTGLFANSTEQFPAFAFSERYLHRLATYQKNVIQFGKPVGIDLPCDENTFAFLYEEQIDDIPQSVRVQNKRRMLLNVQERAIIRERFDRNVRIDRSVNVRVEIPVKVSLFGRNGADYFGKVIDPHRPVNWLNQDAASFLSLALQTPGDIHYLISQEPDVRTHPKQHKSWQQYRQVPSFQYVDVSEIEKIERVAELKNVHRVLGVNAEEE
jgi:hypothetical protein